MAEDINVNEKQPHRLLFYMRIAWGISFILFILLGYEQYLYAIDIIAPVIDRIVFIVSGIILFREYFDRRMFVHPFFIFTLCYFFFSLFWFAIGGFQSYALDTFKGSVYMVLYGVILIMVFPNLRGNRNIYTLTGIVALVAGVYSVYSDDGSLLIRLADSLDEGPARRAGNYLNANAAANMFIWMLAFLIIRLRNMAIMPFFLLVAFGIILTLSRSGFLLLGFMIVSYLLRGYFPRKVFLGIFIILAFVSSSEVLFESILSLFGSLQADSVDRLSFFFLKNVGDSFQTDDRYELVGFAIQNFWNSPIIGNGMGYTTIWNTMSSQGTHNMMLMHLVEYGITGLWIIPGLIIALWKSGKALDWQDRLVWCIIIFLGSFFSHNYFDSMTSVFVMSMLFFMPPAHNKNTELELYETA